MKFKLKVLIYFMVSVIFGAAVFTPPAYAKEPVLASEAAVLIDGDSGLVLFEKNAGKKLYPASTTKIMTAIVALENAELTDETTVSHNAVYSISPDSSAAGLYEGEEINVEELLYTLLVASANDSANVLAEHVSGSIDAFVALMNQKAKEIGADNTHFVNTHGLHDENHYTTAGDIAKIAVYAMKNPTFAEIVSHSTYTLEPTNKYDKQRTYTNTNQLLNPNCPYYVKGAAGIKTGYTGEAKNCLVASAGRGGVNLIAVALCSSPVENKVMSFVDSKNLLEYGFSEFPPKKVVSKGEIISDLPIKNAKGSRKVVLEAEEDLSLILPKNVTEEEVEVLEYIRKKVSAPIKKGDLMGRKDYRYDGALLGAVNMVATADYARLPFAPVINFFTAVFCSIWFYLAVLVLLSVWIYNNNKKRRRASRRRRLNKEY